MREPVLRGRLFSRERKGGKKVVDLKKMPSRRLLEFHYRLFEAVEVRGRATWEEMRLYFESRYELERRGCTALPGAPCLERSDAA